MTSLPTSTPPALDSLHGLSVGDALGAQFFLPDHRDLLNRRQAPPGPWPWTDDTEMACSVHAARTERGGIDTFDLTHAFARRHDFDRGYGPAANRLLRLVREGGDAPRLAAALFDGRGSYGNGAAMRVAPLGAAHAADPAGVVRPAADTAVITHTHPQAVDGAIAVAVAAAYAVRARTEPTSPERFLAAVAALTPPGAVRRGIAEALRLTGADPLSAARVLGNGSRVSAADTVPFALWVAARRLTDYPTAIWETIGAGGDVDTTAAIVGGVVAARTGTAGIPAGWLAAREPLPDWATPAPGSVAAAPVPRCPIQLPRPAPVPPVRWSEEHWQRIRSGLLPPAAAGRLATHTAEGVLHVHLATGPAPRTTVPATGPALAEITVEPLPGPDGGWRPVSAVVEAHPRHHDGEGAPLVARLLALL
ncbi:ADP-ribosylglycohydrolase family protein [Kitasatospora sp. NPDC094015]|uniref:ADP-ribosylglycohydrolase family protein n=1 Tax=Kitasatospora sp. NPDC094015 TaxID=3155205 RepID=UPI00332BAA0A